MSSKVAVRARTGTTVPIIIVTRERTASSTDGSLRRVNGCAITLTNPRGAAATPTGTFLFKRAGEFLYYWNTRGLTRGNWELKFDIGLNLAGERIVKEVTVQLS